MGGMATIPVRPRARWTHEELDALPDDGMRRELLDGVLLVSPAPVTRHQRAVTRVWQLLDAACPAGHEVFVAPFDWRPDAVTSLEPDVLLVPQTALTDANVTGTPAVVVEVLSPGTARIDRTAKMSRYAEGGIGQYWLVDPGDEARPASVEVYDLVGGAGPTQRRGERDYRLAARAEGGYRLQASAAGDEEVTITGLATVTVAPADLVRPR